jgi:Fe-S-cluster containining protein
MPAQNGSKRQRNFFDTCSQCKTGYSCCNDTTPPISRERRKIIEAYLKENKVRILNPFAKTGYVFPRISEDGYCVFHDKRTKKCLVHPVKPETCVAGPITFDINVKNQRIEWYVKMEKICQLARVVYEDKELLRKHLESAKREILRLVKELDSEALKAILEKAEPETFKMGEDNVERKVLDKLACR